MSDIICEKEIIITEEEMIELTSSEDEMMSSGDESTSSVDISASETPQVHHGYQMVVMMIETPTECTMDAFISEKETVCYTVDFEY